ncbi:hypothetical protein U1Q18_027221 [Sarracenia purpurea var. burkii]
MCAKDLLGERDSRRRDLSRAARSGTGRTVGITHSRDHEAGDPKCFSGGISAHSTDWSVDRFPRAVKSGLPEPQACNKSIFSDYISMQSTVGIIKLTGCPIQAIEASFQSTGFDSYHPVDRLLCPSRLKLLSSRLIFHPTGFGLSDFGYLVGASLRALLGYLLYG